MFPFPHIGGIGLLYMVLQIGCMHLLGETVAPATVDFSPRTAAHTPEPGRPSISCTLPRDSASPTPVKVGERVVAVVVTKPDAALTLSSITDILRGAGQRPRALPEQLELVDALPNNPAGTVLKRELHGASNKRQPIVPASRRRSSSARSCTFFIGWVLPMSRTGAEEQRTRCSYVS